MAATIKRKKCNAQKGNAMWWSWLSDENVFCAFNGELMMNSLFFFLIFSGGLYPYVLLCIRQAQHPEISASLLASLWMFRCEVSHPREPILFLKSIKNTEDKIKTYVEMGEEKFKESAGCSFIVSWISVSSQFLASE